MFLTIAILSLGVGAFLDGASTDFAIKRGHVEVDPIMVRIFGTDRPTSRTIFLRGAAVISAESLAALGVAHFHPHAAVFLAAALFIQAAIHGFEAYRGYTFKAAN